jgi:Family of unknown function (DUF6533)
VTSLEAYPELAAAALTWVAYDVCLTFGQEVSKLLVSFSLCPIVIPGFSYMEVRRLDILIFVHSEWKLHRSKLTLSKILYFFLRYYGIFALTCVSKYDFEQV